MRVEVGFKIIDEEGIRRQKNCLWIGSRESWLFNNLVTVTWLSLRNRKEEISVRRYHHRLAVATRQLSQYKDASISALLSQVHIMKHLVHGRDGLDLVKSEFKLFALFKNFFDLGAAGLERRTLNLL